LAAKSLLQASYSITSVAPARICEDFAVALEMSFCGPALQNEVFTLHISEAAQGVYEHPRVRMDRLAPSHLGDRRRGKDQAYAVHVGRQGVRDIHAPDRRAAEERYELPPPHSITSSARASSVGGTSRPSAFAVLRLMTNWRRDDCTTGRSAGL